ncbi:MAG: ATP-binding protein [Sandaracinaceae bacterium]|nr:ATP-binding protein [Sandaracinaceae bacterium]
MTALRPQAPAAHPPHLLILDDLGLRLLSGDEPGDLYEIIRHRYERGSIVITSNRDVEELAHLFGDPLLASAAMDQLLHHAEVIRIEGDSYRNRPPTAAPAHPARNGKEASDDSPATRS